MSAAGERIGSYDIIRACGNVAGQLQQTLPRVTKKPPVNFAKGGSDFRCPHWEHTTSLGKQVRDIIEGTARACRIWTQEKGVVLASALPSCAPQMLSGIGRV